MSELNYFSLSKHPKRVQITWGPRTQNSPTSPGPNVFPELESMIFASVFEGRIPHEPGFLIFIGIVVMQGASLIPSPKGEFRKLVRRKEYFSTSNIFHIEVSTFN